MMTAVYTCGGKRVGARRAIAIVCTPSRRIYIRERWIDAVPSRRQANRKQSKTRTRTKPKPRTKTKTKNKQKPHLARRTRSSECEPGRSSESGARTAPWCAPNVHSADNSAPEGRASGKRNTLETDKRRRG